MGEEREEWQRQARNRRLQTAVRPKLYQYMFHEWCVWWMWRLEGRVCVRRLLHVLPSRFFLCVRVFVEEGGSKKVTGGGGQDRMRFVSMAECVLPPKRPEVLPQDVAIVG